VNKIRSHGILASLVGAVLALSLVQPVQAQAPGQPLDEYIKIVRGDMAKRRDSALRGLIQLSEAEAKAFWPLKEAYDAELKELGEVDLKLIREFGKTHDKLSPEKATELAGRFFDLEEQHLALHRKYFKKISEEVSPVVAVQFLQLQRQFETMADLKLITNAPLATR
jgi:hypothetical protein